MAESLLEQAKKVVLKQRGQKRETTDDEIELCLAILKEEIRPCQAVKVLYPSHGQSVGNGQLYGRMVPVMREAFKRGRIKIV